MLKTLLLALALCLALGAPAAMAHMPDQCLSQMRKMNTWMTPKKADAQQLGEAGERLTALVPANVRLSLAKGEPLPPDWSPDLGEIALILDTFGSAASNYLLADEMFTKELGTLLVCIAEDN